ncbi:hypothetical protein [uncultured Sulfitobacter sp.]|uniref:hypothetical protein n=1 Tax=uncultured Sulfitobacter sp. TaxID=191468 RepID=UPI002595EE8A|nr:hypothetical protein [uncultured Sulfitobacter sp.]
MNIEMKEATTKFLKLAYEAQMAGKPFKRVDVVTSQTEGNIADVVEVVGFITVGDVEDTIRVTTPGQMFLGIRPEGLQELPVTLAEVTHKIDESELVGRYIDSKARAASAVGVSNAEQITVYQLVSYVLTEIAHEVRQGLHIPELKFEGQVASYQDSNDTGNTHAEALRMFFIDVHERNVKAGWWTDLKSGNPAVRSPAEMMLLQISEIVEAYVGYLEGSADDKLPQHPQIGVEIGDTLIRIADFCGALLLGKIVIAHDDPGAPEVLAMMQEIVAVVESHEIFRKRPMDMVPDAIDPETVHFLPEMDVARMTDDKLAFNANREDHKIANRVKEGGKKS